MYNFPVGHPLLICLIVFIANIRLTKPFGGKSVKWILTGPLIIFEYFFTPFTHIRVVSRGNSLVVMTLLSVPQGTPVCI